MPQPKDKEAWVNKLVATWKPRLLLSGWAVIVELQPKNKSNSTYDIHAEIIVNPRYTEGRLRVYPSLFTKPIGYQKSTIIHELAHLATEAIRETLELSVKKKVITAKVAEDLTEQITEYIAKVVFSAYSKSNKNYQL